MTHKQAYHLAKGLFHRRKQAEAIPIMEASLIAYLKTRHSTQFKLGRFAVRLEKETVVIEEAPVEPINQRYFFFVSPPQPKPQREEVNVSFFTNNTF